MWNGYRRGVNLGGWLSQCDYSDARLDTFITARDFETIAGWGADHVRVPVDYNVLERPDGYDRVGRAIAWARESGLNVIIDLHKTPGYSFYEGEGEGGLFGSEALQERFCAIWEEMARRFGGDPQHVAFELLNEVTDPQTIGAWNALSHRCIGRIRAAAPTTPVLVGSHSYNNVEAVADLSAPYDGNEVYNFHCYAPFKFTHQGAGWTPAINPSERWRLADFEVTPEYFLRLFAPAAAKARAEGVALYCGEYGVICHAAPEDTVKWYRAIHEAFEALDIGRAAWSYRQMSFGLADERLDGVRAELVRYL